MNVTENIAIGRSEEGYGDVRYCCTTPLPEGEGNISATPLFVSIGPGEGLSHAGGDYRLSPGSPCINVGANQDWMANATDLAGHPRIVDGRVDLGAYEFESAQKP